MPSVLVRLPEIACAPMNSCRDRNLQRNESGETIRQTSCAHRIMCMLQHYCRQEPWHPFLDGIRETVDESTYANDSSVPLADSGIVYRRFTTRELDLSR